jgi:hypothetical protein
MVSIITTRRNLFDMNFSVEDGSLTNFEEYIEW